MATSYRNSDCFATWTHKKRFLVFSRYLAKLPIQIFVCGKLLHWHIFSFVGFATRIKRTNEFFTMISNYFWNTFTTSKMQPLLRPYLQIIQNFAIQLQWVLLGNLYLKFKIQEAQNISNSWKRLFMEVIETASRSRLIRFPCTINPI